MTRLSDQNEYHIRYSQQDDLPPLKEWLSHKEVQRWYPISMEKDREIMAKNWIGFSRYAAGLTAVYKGEPVGIATLFLMPYRKLIHHCLFYFIVNPQYVGGGVGTSLIRNITHLGKNYFHLEKLHIEVYEGCPGISLLIKEGYHEVFRQEHFIKESDGTYLARIVYETLFNAEEIPRSIDGK